MGSSALMDYLGSTIVFAVLVFTVARLQVNLNATMYHNTLMYATQNYTLSMSRQIEFDFHKIGYRVNTARIDTAEAQKIRFKYYIYGNFDSLRTITYHADTTRPDELSQNPRDFVLVRNENNNWINAWIGLTDFRLTYFNSSLDTIPTPVTGADLDSIHAIHVRMRLESLEPVIMPDETRYMSVMWEKLIYPRNLARKD